MLETLLRHLEGRCKVQDRPAVLDGHDTAAGKAAPVTLTVDLVHNRCIDIAATQKVRVQ